MGQKPSHTHAPKTDTPKSEQRFYVYYISKSSDVSIITSRPDGLESITVFKMTGITGNNKFLVFMRLTPKSVFVYTNEKTGRIVCKVPDHDLSFGMVGGMLDVNAKIRNHWPVTRVYSEGPMFANWDKGYAIREQMYYESEEYKEKRLLNNKRRQDMTFFLGAYHTHVKESAASPLPISKFVIQIYGENGWPMNIREMAGVVNYLTAVATPTNTLEIERQIMVVMATPVGEEPDSEHESENEDFFSVNRNEDGRRQGGGGHRNRGGSGGNQTSVMLTTPMAMTTSVAMSGGECNIGK